MSAMERSLRRALDAGDFTDPGFREAIYTASERALERMLEDKGTDPAAAHAQRVRLAETINRVEDDYYARQVEAGDAEEGPAQHDPLMSLDPAYADAHDYGTNGHSEPAAEPEAERASDFDPVAAAMPPQGLAQTPDPRWDAEAFPVQPGREAPRRRRRPLLLVLIGALLILALLAFLISAFDGARGGASAAVATDPWISVFAGTELQGVAASGGAAASAIDADGRPALRLTSNGAEGTLALDVGPGLVRHLAGRRVEVELTAGTPTPGREADFGVRCLFGGKTVCGRRSFAANQASQTFVFEMVLPAGVGEGAIAIDPATAGGLDVFSLRLRPAGRA